MIIFKTFCFKEIMKNEYYLESLITLNMYVRTNFLIKPEFQQHRCL